MASIGQRKRSREEARRSPADGWSHDDHWEIERLERKTKGVKKDPCLFGPPSACVF